MLTEAEIKSHYKGHHDELTGSYYMGTSGLTKEQFDIEHGKIWALMGAELVAGGYLQPTLPMRNLESEIDSLEKRVKALEPK